MASISMLSVPSLLSAPPGVVAKQFAVMYNIGKVTQPPFTLITALNFFYPSYRKYEAAAVSDSSLIPIWKLYTLARGSVFSALPYTFGLMEKTSHKPLRLGEQTQEKRKDGAAQEIRALIYGRGVLNMVRSVFPLVGAVLGFWIVFDS